MEFSLDPQIYEAIFGWRASVCGIARIYVAGAPWEYERFISLAVRSAHCGKKQPRGEIKKHQPRREVCVCAAHTKHVDLITLAGLLSIEKK